MSFFRRLPLDFLKQSLILGFGTHLLGWAVWPEIPSAGSTCAHIWLRWLLDSISQDFMASTLPTKPAPLPLTVVVDSESRDVNARQT